MTVKFAYLPLLLILWFDRCESLNDSSVPSIFFPFGSDQGDTYFIGDDVSDGPINISYNIFNRNTVYVRCIMSQAVHC